VNPGRFAVSLDEPFLRVVPQEGDKYKTCVPLFSLQAAAGAFGEVQLVEVLEVPRV